MDCRHLTLFAATLAHLCAANPYPKNLKKKKNCETYILGTTHCYNLMIYVTVINESLLLYRLTTFFLPLTIYLMDNYYKNCDLLGVIGIFGSFITV